MDNIESVENLVNVDPKIFGYGEPGNDTKSLMAAGLITIEFVEGDTPLWHAFLTDTGMSVLATLPKEND